MLKRRWWKWRRDSNVRHQEHGQGDAWVGCTFSGPRNPDDREIGSKCANPAGLPFPFIFDLFEPHNLKKKMGQSRPLFVTFQYWPKTGNEPRISYIASNCSTNWTTTTAHQYNFLQKIILQNLEPGGTWTHNLPITSLLRLPLHQGPSYKDVLA